MYEGHGSLFLLGKDPMGGGDGECSIVSDGFEMQEFIELWSGSDARGIFALMC